MRLSYGENLQYQTHSTALVDCPHGHRHPCLSDARDRELVQDTLLHPPVQNQAEGIGYQRTRYACPPYHPCRYLLKPPVYPLGGLRGNIGDKKAYWPPTSVLLDRR